MPLRGIENGEWKMMAAEHTVVPSRHFPFSIYHFPFPRRGRAPAAKNTLLILTSMRRKDERRLVPYTSNRAHFATMPRARCLKAGLEDFPSVPRARLTRLKEMVYFIGDTEKPVVKRSILL
jgi:hypothetical protein